MRRRSLAGWIFAGPALIMLGLFFLVPVLLAFALSLTNFDLYSLADYNNTQFVGFANYAEMVRTPLFWKALGNTFYFVIVGVPLSIGLSLGAAMLLNGGVSRLTGLFRTALFAPVVTTLVAVAVIWRYLLHTRYGMINYGAGERGRAGRRLARRPALVDAGDHPLRRVEEFRLQYGDPARRASDHPERSLRSRADRRRQWLAALPPRHLAGARADAAAGVDPDHGRLFPALRRALCDGPVESTVSVLYFMYDQGFKWWNLGFASAVAFGLFLIMIVFTTLQYRFAQARGMT
jgi:ABC-type sugar transport systems, permease components